MAVLELEQIGAVTRMTTEEKEAEVERLKRSRVAYRGHITRNINKSVNLMSQDEPAVQDISSYIELIETKLEAIRGLDKQIADNLDGDNLDVEISESLDYHDEIITSKNKMVHFVKSKTQNVGVSDGASGSTFGFGRGTHTKLPRIMLKEFSGDLIEWSSFWDGFEASVHLNPKISDVDKMNYLRGLLKGDAL